MSAGETIYSVGAPYPDYLVRGRDQTVSLPLYRAASLAEPSAGTFALFDPAGSTVISATAVTVTGAIATYAVSAASLPATLTLGHGYREDWALTCQDGVTRTYRRDAALVMYAAYPVISDADLTAVYSDLERHLSADVHDFQSYIDEAWKRILGRLEGQGVFPELVVTSWSLREVHLELTLHLVCLDFARAAGGRWLDLAASHKREFEMAWKRLRFVRGTGDGTADGDHQRAASKGVTWANASPRSSWSGYGGM